MFKLLVLLSLLAFPAQQPPPTPMFDSAILCHLFKDGMDCREVQATTPNEICWCTPVDNSWVFCGCAEPRHMSTEEYLEYLIYLGKPDEVKI